jgi:hypothetical protein
VKLEERSYSGKTFRPRPVVSLVESDSVLMVLSSWGHRDSAEQVTQIFSDQLQLSDSEDFTSPFGHVESLGPIANRLKTAAHLANALIYREVNHTEYVAGLEVLALSYKDSILSWVQVGGPHLLLKLKDSLQPLASQYDWSWQFNQSSPLPSECLGLQASLNVHCGSLFLAAGADLFLVARGAIPAKAFELPPRDIAAMTRILVEDNSETPFWLGHVGL